MADDLGRYHLMSRGEKTEAITLGTLSGKLDMVVESVNALNKNISNLTKEQAVTSSSIKSSWHDINELKIDVKMMPDKWKDALREHESECIPRVKARSLALTSANEGRRDDSQQIDTVATADRTRSVIPLRWLIIGGIVVLCSTLVAGILIGSVVSDAPRKTGETIKSFAVPKK